MRAFFADVDLNVFVHELYFCQSPIELTRLGHLDISNAILLELFQEQIDVHWPHRPVLVGNVFLEQTIHELFRNAFHLVVAFVDMMNVVSDFEQTRKRR